jgi:hypothetical protein
MISSNSMRLISAQLIETIGLLQCREVISAWAGQKIARIGVNQLRLKQTLKLLDELCLPYQLVPELVFAKRDVGKGGWSNKFHDKQNISPNKGDHLIYVGNTSEAVSRAMKADFYGEEGEFGDKLGIPSCCIDFYLTQQETAFQKQNDFVPLVFKNTTTLHSFNFWNNYVSQYFGYSLLSFFPCSFNCRHAADLAKNTYDLIHSIVPEQAEKILHFQMQPILYTEYRGIYLFEGAKSQSGKTFIRDCTIHSTLNQASRTHQLISQSKEIQVAGKLKINITSKDEGVIVINNSNWVMCTFI